MNFGIGLRGQEPFAGTTVVERYAYDEFGKQTVLDASVNILPGDSADNNPFGYTSRRHDKETGLMYFRARYYDNQTGEFISRDPLEYVDGMSMYRGYFVPDAHDSSGLRSMHEREFPSFYPSATKPKREFCGNLKVLCPNCRLYYWPVYGNSRLAHSILSQRWGNKVEGCVTLVHPSRIECTGDCEEIKSWNADEAGKVPILSHEGCHVCSYEILGILGWAMLASWDNCDDYWAPTVPVW